MNKLAGVATTLILMGCAAHDAVSIEDDGGATYLDHLAMTLNRLGEEDSAERAMAIGRLLFYKEEVSNGILVEHWFAEGDGMNREELLRGLKENEALSDEVINRMRRAVPRYAPTEAAARAQELDRVLAPETRMPNKSFPADAEKRRG